MSWGDEEIGYFWRPRIELNDPEPKHVLGRLKLNGIKIELDEQSILRLIESYLNQYLPCFWALAIAEIANAIRRELVKWRNVIDADLVRQVVEYLKSQARKKEGWEDEWSDEEEEAQEEESDSSSDSDSDDDEAEVDAAKEAKEEERDDLKDDPTTRKRCIFRLIYLAKKRGMSVNPGDEEAILDLMIPYLRESVSTLTGIDIFLDRVSEYINRCSILDNLETVETALQKSSFREYWKVKEEEEDMVVDANKDQPLKKNLMPTKEEGIATPMNQITQEEEKRETGDVMEIQETETSMIPLNLPEQPKESMGNAYFCVKESLERAGGSKRKLAQV